MSPTIIIFLTPNTNSLFERTMPMFELSLVERLKTMQSPSRKQLHTSTSVNELMQSQTQKQLQLQTIPISSKSLARALCNRLQTVARVSCKFRKVPPITPRPRMMRDWVCVAVNCACASQDVHVLLRQARAQSEIEFPMCLRASEIRR